ncbi:flagellar biosynthesis protein FlhB [bacterium]|nr:flagellar biosynthesis protein FlhB [bacterium]MBU1983827.1 flagellar biosynthesis protein FlhB [bacterium]
MSFLNDEGRTEKPTPRRRTKARSEGSVSKSAELNSAAVLIAASLLLIWFGHHLMRGLEDITRTIFRHSGTVEFSAGTLQTYMFAGMKVLAILLAPLMLGILAVGVLVNVGQVGFKITPKAARPKFSRMNPIRGLGRLFSLRSLVELGKNLLKLALIGGVVYLTISAEIEKIYSLAHLPIGALVPMVGQMLARVFLYASLSLILIGILDYLYNRYEFEKSLKMTKEEVKEEAKQSEGDPHVKSKIREIMIKGSLARMMKKVPEADVVITNPVHLAIALKYDRKKSSAPVVLAKGARKVAERIKAIAEEHNIPIVENPPLAQALYKAVEIGQEIPISLYKAVAEVLAYVYRLKRKFFGVA